MPQIARTIMASTPIRANAMELLQTLPLRMQTAHRTTFAMAITARKKKDQSFIRRAFMAAHLTSGRHQQVDRPLISGASSNR